MWRWLWTGFGCPGNRWWMADAHTKEHKTCGSSWRTSALVTSGTFRFFWEHHHPLSLCGGFCFLAGLALTLPHLLLCSAATQTANHVCANSVYVQRATIILFCRRSHCAPAARICRLVTAWGGRRREGGKCDLSHRLMDIQGNTGKPENTSKHSFLVTFWSVAWDKQTKLPVKILPAHLKPTLYRKAVCDGHLPCDGEGVLFTGATSSLFLVFRMLFFCSAKVGLCWRKGKIN